MLNPKLIAFYLPQYHPIPENDEWWGKGFTDWVNTVKGKPRFYGHYQPHIPADLGFYDLRNEETRIAQAELAKNFGLYGFCYYHYWFNGKMLLEKPFNEVLKTKKPDFPFCLCWANENWTRTWDGEDSKILIKQDYELYDPIQHISWLKEAFQDTRYIKINNKPIFLIYNAYAISDISKILKIWREYLKDEINLEIYICSVRSIHNKFTDDEIISLGFDAIVDFTPNGRDLPKMKLWSIPQNILYRALNKLISYFNLTNVVSEFPVKYVYDYKSLVSIKVKKGISKYKIFPCVIPSWDNSARRKIAAIIQNNNEELYKIWLKDAVKRVSNHSSDEQIVFINAWNEWAEGCHLEPDLRNGKKFLEATLDVLNSIRNE
ncbi:MAG: glycoside hydrolase family 99-like domain-containing protein [Candidatus Woesearchaeota archaeon]